MFDVFLYPVSAILWFWHKVFGAFLSPGSGAAWVLSIAFLVFTLRLLLVKPALSALRAGRRTQALAPQLRKIQEKYGKDRQRMAKEIQKLHADNGSSPLAGCLPALVQLPVFLSLYWVLRDFTPGARSNHVFDRAEVESFLNAGVFGAKLGNWLSQPAAELAAFGTDHTDMFAVGIPLMLVAGLATFFSMRSSLNRQTSAAPQAAGITKLMMYLAPLGMLVSGSFFPVPIGVLLYFLATNVWTLGQQHFLTKVLDREEAARVVVKPKATAPRPGQKPRRG
ncbi:membrane protein insertase YidC [Amycolatopsis regifaucium]|uniref:Membrane protein insertase YidC n=1 Tax=Amycolatopsis regifaucium TaxID=546365 RepID=A0A154M550_9PSEU|nr:membrane protein insertase YidC [Amycolatopsis regifaucium]KZB79722.1 preprotein translocase YidC [Amycolatopsis regifaucium]OKA09962.1 preprotein translocase YidC [Amycolatopsis regifaucium]SFI67237.1 YidC/Oxa1 family membrane protein insertase [Amycolatopsis regifaucium]